MTDKLFVVRSNGEKEKWQPDKIKQTIINETNVDEELASRIKNRIQRKIYKLQKLILPV